MDGDKDACNEGVQYLVIKHPDIEKVFISDGSEVTDNGLQSLLSAPCMKSVGVAGRFSGETISPRSNTAQYLQELKLESYDLKDSGLFNILEGCTPALKSLQVSNACLTGEGLKSLQGKFQQLEKLHLHLLNKLTYEGVTDLIAISGNCLKQLGVIRCYITGNALITAVQGKLDNLERLELEDLPELTNQDYVNILKNCGNRLTQIIIRSSLPLFFYLAERLIEHNT